MTFARVEQALHGVLLSSVRVCMSGSADEYEPQQPYYYTGVLSVYRFQPGRGLAGKLLKMIHGVSQQDSESTGVCLFIENESTLPFVNPWVMTCWLILISMRG